MYLINRVVFFSIVSVLGLCCGGSSGLQSAGLPLSGTDHLERSVRAGGGNESRASRADLWAGKEMISPPVASAKAALQLPKIQSFRLKNGLEVIALLDSKIPVTTMQLALKVGTQDVEPDKAGIAELAVQSMVRGTKKRSASRMAKEIEAVGGHLQASASLEATLFSCKTLAKDFKTCMSLIPDVLINPSFKKSEIQLVKRNMLSALWGRLDDAGLLASAHFKSALWGDNHARGWMMSGASLAGTDRQDLVDWHQRYFVPSNAVLTIAGNFNPLLIQSSLERSFGRWKDKAIQRKPLAFKRKLQGLKIRLVDKPGQSQSHIRLGHYGLAHSDPDYYASVVFNYIFGGGQFSSRLMKVVRSSEGKAYVASSRIDKNREAGAFVVGTFIRSAETVSTVKLILKLMAEMQKEGPTERERQDAITHISGQYKTRFEGVSDMANALLAANLHGLSEGYVRDYPLEIAKVDLAQVQKIAAKIVDPVNLVLVIVGDAKIVGPQLERVGWNYELVSYEEPISNIERLQKKKSNGENPDDASLLAAAKLLDEALEKKGGAAHLKALKSFHWIGEAVLNLPTGAMRAKVEKHYAKPGKLRLDMEIGGGQVQIATVLSGKTGWAKEKNPKEEKVRDFSALEWNALRVQLWHDAELVLLRHQEKGTYITKVLETKLGGQKVFAISLQNKLGHGVTLFVDPTSKHLLGMDYSDQGGMTSERYGDYKKIKGIWVAHKRSTKGMQIDMQVELKSFVHGTPLSPSVFSKTQGLEEKEAEKKK